MSLWKAKCKHKILAEKCIMTRISKLSKDVLACFSFLCFFVVVVVVVVLLLLLLVFIIIIIIIDYLQ